MTGVRVLHVIDNLAPGGTERQCLELVRGLSRLGVQNAVVYCRTGSLLAELERYAVRIRRLPMPSFRSVRFPLALARLAREMRQWMPDVVQTYGFYGNVPGLLSAAAVGVPVRVAGRRDLAAYLRPAQQRADRWTWKLAHRIVVNSDAVRRQLVGRERVAPQKVVVIRNGLNLRNWQPRGADDISGAVVGMVAHFRQQKDHATFLRAAVEILRVVPGVRFRLVGSGPLEKATRNHAHELGIASHVDFLGTLEGDALRDAVRQFRVSVLTSKANEGLPNAVLESMAVGLPVVATAVGGIPEIVEHDVTGFLVPPDTPAALAERVICLLKEPSLAQRLGDRARSTVEQAFTIDRMVDEFYGLYRDLLR